jgi:secreted trypsin-like serine protease
MECKHTAVTSFFFSRSAHFLVCGVRGRNQKIVGGSETHPNEYPWVAGLFKQNKLYCGATVVSNRFLLTVNARLAFSVARFSIFSFLCSLRRRIV